MQLPKIKLPRIKRRVFLSWLVSYLFILLCSIITSVLIYTSATLVLEKEVQNVSRSSLDNMKTLIDGKLRELGSAATLLEVDINIKKVVSYPQDIWNEDTAIDYKRCIDLFTRTMANNQYISNIYLYARKSNIIISSKYGFNGKVSSRFPAEEAFGIELKEFGKLLKNQPVFRYMILPETENNSISRILFLYPVEQSGMNSDGILIFQLNTDKLMTLVNGSQSLIRTGFAVIDRKNLTVDTGNSFFDHELFKYDQLGSKPSQYKFGSRNHLVYSIQSDLSAWRYVFAHDMQEYLRSIHYLRNMTILLLVIFAILGVFLSIALTKHNYNPLQKVLMRASPNFKPTGANEFQVLEKSFTNLFQEKESYTQRLKRQRDVILNSLFVQLLKGRNSAVEKLMEAMALEGMSFRHTRFLVILLDIEDFGLLLEEEGEDPQINNAAELSFLVVKNILEELLGEEQKGYVVEIETMLACIVNVSEEEDSVLIGRVEKIVCDAIEFIKKHFNMVIYAAVSNIYPGMHSLNKSFQEAAMALERSILLASEQSVTSYRNLVSPVERTQSGYSRLEKRYAFLNSLMAKNIDLAERVALEFTELDPKDDNAANEFRIQKYSLIDDLRSALETLKAESGKRSWQQEDELLLEIARCKNTAALRLQLKKLFSQFRSLYKEKYDPSRLNEKLQEIITFIGNNLTNPDLSVSMLSEHAGLSVSHVTRLMRSRLGLGALEYIQKMRIDTAKKLLRETDLSVNEIARNVGYYNFRTMNYVFKRLEGTTGTQYREQIKKVNLV